jgi:WD40 repeat protein
VTAGQDATARIWDVETERQLTVLKGHHDWITRLAFTGDGETIVTAGDDGTVRLWDAGSGAPGPIMRPRAGAIGALVVGPGASPRILSGSFDAGPDAAVIWDSSTGRALHRLPLAGGAALAAAFSADGRRVATGELNGTVRVWAVGSGRPLATLTGHTGPISDLAFTDDGSLLVSASGDGVARLWDVGQERVVEELLGHDGWVTTAAFAPDERTILTANQDGTARIWDATAAEPREQLRTGLTSAYASFAPDGESVLTAGPAVVPILWNPETGSQNVAVSDPTLIATHAALSPDGSLIATTSEGHFVGAEIVDADLAQVWTAGGGLERTLRGHDARINSVTFSPDSETIVTASDDGTARIWELSSGDSQTLEGPGRDVKSAAFSPDGTQVVTAGTDEKARLWDAASGEQIRVLSGHAGTVYSAAFSPDGELVVTGSGDNTARIWDLAGGRTRVVLTGHEDTVGAARFSPDGRFVVTASHDGTARVWDAFTGDQLLEFRAGDPRLGGPKGANRRLLRAAAASGLDPAELRIVADAGFDPSGRRIVTASYDGVVRVYRCEICGTLDDLLSRARAEVTRGLTAAERREFLGE